MRPAIIKLHEKGYSTREIEQLLDVSQSSVSRHIKRYKETGNHKDREERGRKKTARKFEFFTFASIHKLRKFLRNR